jgi:probable phosphoglycerate mutase
MLILVRHGRTAANASGLLQGRADHPLDDVGRRQVARVADSLATVRVARVVASPLSRARDTACAVAARHGTDVIEDPRLIELDYGEWDGRAISEIGPDAWRRWREDPGFKPPGGESLLELDERVHRSVRELWDGCLRTPGEATVVVSHVSPIKSAVVWALAGTPEMTWKMTLDRASITTIATGPHGPALVRFNDTSHLPDDIAR